LAAELVELLVARGVELPCKEVGEGGGQADLRVAVPGHAAVASDEEGVGQAGDAAHPGLHRGRAVVEGHAARGRALGKELRDRSLFFLGEGHDGQVGGVGLLEAVEGGEGLLGRAVPRGPEEDEEDLPARRVLGVEGLAGEPLGGVDGRSGVAEVEGRPRA